MELHVYLGREGGGITGVQKMVWNGKIKHIWETNLRVIIIPLHLELLPYYPITINNNYSDRINVGT